MNSTYWTKWLKITRWIFFLAIGYYVVTALCEEAGALSEYAWSIKPIFLILSFILLMICLCSGGLGWYLILRLLGVKFPFWEAVNIWLTSQLSKYVPGFFWQYLTRVSALKTGGVNAGWGLLSLHLEAIAVVVSATIVTAISGALDTQKVEPERWVAMSIVLFLCLIACHSKVLSVMMNIAFGMIKKPKVELSYSYSKMIGIIFYHVAVWWILSFVFFFLIKAIYPVRNEVFFDITFAFTCSWALGYLAIFAPGGIGVRESALIILLAGTLPEFLGPMLAVLSRLWLITGEIVTFTIVFIPLKIMIMRHKKNLTQEKILITNS